jgi:hypothetical protein
MARLERRGLGFLTKGQPRVLALTKRDSQGENEHIPDQKEKKVAKGIPLLLISSTKVPYDATAEGWNCDQRGCGKIWPRIAQRFLSIEKYFPCSKTMLSFASCVSKFELSSQLHIFPSAV